MSEKPKKYILYGASFNPPHVGHFSAIAQMLEEYDNVIVFPYPQKFAEGKIEALPPIKQRLKMLQIFAMDFFPQMPERLIIINLAAEMGARDGVLHTYDYLNFVKNRIEHNAELSACLGFESKNINRKEDFFNEDKIKKEFPHFYLEEENTLKSEDLRKFFSNHNNIQSKKDEHYIRNAVGNALAEHIFTNNLYGVQKKSNIDKDTAEIEGKSKSKARMK
jgi:nicotinic acid mononucleotide adenylyltransferase